MHQELEKLIEKSSLTPEDKQLWREASRLLSLKNVAIIHGFIEGQEENLKALTEFTKNQMQQWSKTINTKNHV